jgi:hypothetical protein
MRFICPAGRSPVHASPNLGPTLVPALFARDRVGTLTLDLLMNEPFAHVGPDSRARLSPRRSPIPMSMIN